MFEAYSEIARKAFRAGLHEAFQLGNSSVEVEHVLLGVLDADVPLAIRLFKSHYHIQELRSRIRRETPRKKPEGEGLPEPPLSRHCQRVISYAAAEAERLNQKAITTDHLLLAIMRENTSIAASILLDSGVSISQLDELAQGSEIRSRSEAGSQIDGLRDLVAEAVSGQAVPGLSAVTGRQRELDQLVQVLSRRSKNSAVLLGEAGVGKHSLVCGLAQLIADGDVPPDLAERQILVLDFPALLQSVQSSGTGASGTGASGTGHHIKQKLIEVSHSGGPIIYVPGLFNSRAGLPLLASLLKPGRLQLIATGAPLSFRLALERNDELARCFEPIGVLPPSEADSVSILTAMKADFEKFHDVMISSEAIHLAVSASGRFLRQQPLPDRAIDLIDDAAALVKVRAQAPPPALIETKKRERAILRERDFALIANAREKVEQLSIELHELQIKRAALQAEFAARQPDKNVAASDIVNVIAARTALRPEAVRAALDQPPSPEAEAVLRHNLSKRIPVGQRDWLDGFLAYLATCSSEDADYLAQIIRGSNAQ